MSLEEGLFIDEMEKFRCIWDLKHNDHKNKVALENAWETLAVIAECTVEECQELWKSLRTKYIRERKTLKTLPSGSAIYCGTWAHFNRMGFLAPNIQKRRTTSNILKRKSLDTDPPTSVWQSFDEDSVHVEELESQEIDHSEVFASSSVYTSSSVAGSSGVAASLSVAAGSSATQASMVPKPQTSGTTASSAAQASTVPKPQTSGTTESGSLRQERNVSKKKKTDDSVNNLIAQCSSIGQSINTFIKQGSSDQLEGVNKEDYYFALSIAESLSKMKNNKAKIMVKAELLVKIADVIEDD